MKTEHQQRIEQFMTKGGQEVPSSPGIAHPSIRLLRARLVMEEALELMQALGVVVTSRGIGACTINSLVTDLDFNVVSTGSLLDVADACADLSVVTIGTLSAYGISDESLLKEVDENNLSKVHPECIKDENGKILKPKHWQPPNIKRVIGEQLP